MTSERSLTSPQRGVTLARAVVPLVSTYSLVILVISLIAPRRLPPPHRHPGGIVGDSPDTKDSFHVSFSVIVKRNLASLDFSFLFQVVKERSGIGAPGL